MLAIIVVLYKSQAAVRTLWTSLESQRFGDWRLYAVDNGFADEAADFLERRGDERVRVWRSGRNTGFAGGANAGLRWAVAEGADRCLLMNPDVQFDAEFLGGLDEAWTDQEVVAPRVMELSGRDEGKEVVWYAGGSFDRRWVFSTIHCYDAQAPSRVVEFASGCCLGLTSGVLRRVGLLDESLFVYWEDVDLCLRLNEACVPIEYLRDPCLWHEGGASSGGEKAPAAGWLYHESWGVLLRKRFGSRAALKSILRLALKDFERREWRRGFRNAAAMICGLMVRRRPVLHLQEMKASEVFSADLIISQDQVRIHSGVGY